MCIGSFFETRGLAPLSSTDADGVASFRGFPAKRGSRSPSVADDYLSSGADATTRMSRKSTKRLRGDDADDADAPTSALRAGGRRAARRTLMSEAPYGVGLSQSDMMERDLLILVDGDDRVTGAMSKREAHTFGDETPRGWLHRAFSCFLFDARGRTRGDDIDSFTRGVAVPPACRANPEWTYG